MPNVGGTWMWNHWSNGHRGFSMGPPGEDSVMRVQRIEMFYNTTADVTS